MLTDQEIIERNISPEPMSGCWLWTGYVNSWGYGRAGSDRAERAAHRLSYRAFVGPIAVGMRVLHRCDVPCCVNPQHLRLGTDSDNMQDAIAKGRHVTQRGESNPLAKLNREKVQAIRSNKGRETISELARRYAVSRRAISFVLKGETWASVKQG